MIGSFYFLGFAISSAIIPPISDKFGRKWNFYACLMLQTICYTLLFYSKSLKLTTGIYLVIGSTHGSFTSVATNYMNEFLPFEYQSLVITLMNAFIGLVVIW